MGSWLDVALSSEQVVLMRSDLKFLSPKDAERFSSNNPSPYTDVIANEESKKTIDNVILIGAVNTFCEALFII
jgi:hypothetical protein